MTDQAAWQPLDNYLVRATTGDGMNIDMVVCALHAEHAVELYSAFATTEFGGADGEIRVHLLPPVAERAGVLPWEEYTSHAGAA